MTIETNININSKTAKFAAQKIISITQYNTFCSWAEKISNGQRDSVTQIKTHLNKWLGYSLVLEDEILHYIDTDDMNGFRTYLAQFPFVVKDDAGYFHKLYVYYLDDNSINCTLAEIHSDEEAILNAVIRGETEQAIEAEEKLTEAEIEQATEPKIEDYAVSTDAQDAAVEAEEKLAEANELNGISEDMYKKMASVKWLTYTVGTNGKAYWFEFGRRTTQKRAQEILAEYGLTIEEYIGNLDTFHDEALQRYSKSLYVKTKIWYDRQPLNDDDVFNLLPEVSELNDVDENEPLSEFDAEIEQAITVEKIEIGDDVVTYINGKFDSVISRKYGGEYGYNKNGEICYFTIPYNRKELEFGGVDRWDESDFFRIMIQRGACTIDAAVEEYSRDFRAEYHPTREDEPHANDESEFDKAIDDLNKTISESEAIIAAAKKKIADAEGTLRKLRKRKAAEFEQAINTAAAQHRGHIIIQNPKAKIFRREFDGAFSLKVDSNYPGFSIRTNTGTLLGGYYGYNTEWQMLAVIEKFTAAINRGESEFTFPTVDEINQPSVDNEPTVDETDGSEGDNNKFRDSLILAMKLALIQIQHHCQNHDLTAAQNEMALYNICADAMRELDAPPPAEHKSESPAVEEINKPTDNQTTPKFEAGKTYYQRDWLSYAAATSTEPYRIVRRTAKYVFISQTHSNLDPFKYMIRNDSEGEYFATYDGHEVYAEYICTNA